ncbi:MAG: hydroxyacylglutathione hydrolase [Hyphomicrobiales bacterium]
MPELEIHQFFCRSDNYGVLIHDAASGDTATIDAPEAAPIEGALADKGWSLTHILMTHHHADHADGVAALKRKFGCQVVGNAADAARLPPLDATVSPGDTYDFAGHTARIIDTPGHTVGHIVWHFADDRLLFAGDTLFAMGCGRVFEGTFDQMWSSLAKLKALPPETTVYCGHEYTQANARFALTVDPDNPALTERAKKVDDLRSRGAPTLPTTIAAELETNPFLRVDDPAIRRRLKLDDASDAEVFAEVRRRKDAA